jgi:hypothetical protein
MISDIHAKDDLDTTKVVSTVTNSASNFIKAFSEYIFIEMESNGGELSDDDESGGEKQAMNTELIHVDIDTVSSNVSTGQKADQSDEVCTIQLLHHTSCVCHSLNLIGTTDADKASIRSASICSLLRFNFRSCRRFLRCTSRVSLNR